MKRNFIIYVLILLGLTQNSLYAQVTGYAAAFGSPISDPGWTSGVHYMDDNRAKIASYSPSASTANITCTNLSGSFSAGDMALLIQMYGGSGAGIHQNVMITSVSSGSPTAIATVSGANLHSYVVGYAVQLIKINIYVDFTLDGSAEVTCHPWNLSDGTGGVLCMIVKGDLVVDGGIFNAAGKGHYYQEAGVTFGAGGNGGSGSSTSNGAGQASVVDACLDGTGSITLNAGGAGGTNPNNGSAGANNSGIIGALYWQGPTKPTILPLGSPGYYKIAFPGYHGAGGGSGGGAGGNGGNPSSPCSTSGSAGAAGQAGEQGGSAGEGGIGGGAMVIKVGGDVTINGSITWPVFLAYGTNGKNGGCGGKGGDGGSGGAGGQGCCSGSATAQGAPGGQGESGNPGIGGDGGDGGKPGVIWISAAGTYSPSAGSRSVHFNVNGGAGGAGGPGGFQRVFPAPSGYNVINECNTNYCGGGNGYGNPSGLPSGCQNTACNLDKIMCILASDAVSGGLNGSIIEFVNGGANPVVQFNPSTGEIIGIEYSVGGCAGTFYHVANLYDAGICGDIFKQLAGLLSFKTTPLTIDLNYSTNTDCSNIGNPALDILLSFNINGGATPLIWYSYTAATKERKLYSVDGDICNNGPCMAQYNFSGGSNTWGWVAAASSGGELQAGTSGRSGDAGGNGSFDDSDTDPNANGAADDGGNSWFMGLNDLTNAFRLSLYPNPTKGNMWLSVNSPKKGEAVVTVYDLQGRQVLTHKLFVQNGENKLSVSTGELPSGNYLLQMRLGGKLSKQSFTVAK